MTSKLKGLVSQNTVKPCYHELNRTEFFPGILDIIIQDIRFNIVLSETIAITSVFTLIDPIYSRYKYSKYQRFRQCYCKSDFDM